MENIFANLPASLPDELVQVLVSTAQLRIERIVSLGHCSPPGFWYDAAEHEWVMLLSGRAQLEFEGEEPVELLPGDHVHIDAHRRHRVAWTTPDEPTVWLAVYHGS